MLVVLRTSGSHTRELYLGRWLSIRRGDRVAYACHLLHIAVDANLDPDYKF